VTCHSFMPINLPVKIRAYDTGYRHKAHQARSTV
jgi:hypothetical protein